METECVAAIGAAEIHDALQSEDDQTSGSEKGWRYHQKCNNNNEYGH